MAQLTIKEIAEKLDVEYTVARGLVVFLMTKGIIKKDAEVRKVPGAKGKGSDVYEFNGDMVAAEMRTVLAGIGV